MGRVRSHVDEFRGLAIQIGNSRQERGVLSSIPGQAAGLDNLIEPVRRLDAVDLIRGALVDTSMERVRPRSQAGVSCGNAGAVESVESQRQASHSFHEPLGNLAKSRRDPHISPAPATRADGKVENQKQVSHFPTAPSRYLEKQKNHGGKAIAPPAVAAALRAAAMTSTSSVTFL